MLQDLHLGGGGGLGFKEVCQGSRGFGFVSFHVGGRRKTPRPQHTMKAQRQTKQYG